MLRGYLTRVYRALFALPATEESGDVERIHMDIEVHVQGRDEAVMLIRGGERTPEGLRVKGTYEQLAKVASVINSTLYAASRHRD